MAFSERIQQLRPEVSNEQATELREVLVEACQQLQADPELMGMGLQRLKEELTDQGYEWENLVGTMLQLIDPSLTVESAKKLKEAWNDSMASNATITDFTAILNSDFPIINDVFRDLANEALQEHNALIGLAGGTHIGQGIATAGSKTGRALASPWNKNSKLNKKQRIMAETAEVGVVGAGVFFGGRPAGRAIYNAGEKSQLWGAINTKIGGKDGPSIKEMISGDLPGDGQGPHFKVLAGNRDQFLNDIINARDALIQKSGQLSTAEETQLYNNARAILRPKDEKDDSSRDVVNKIEYSLHPDSDYREMATAIHNIHIKYTVPEFARHPIQEVENELEKNGINIEQININRIDDKYKIDPLRPATEEANEFGLIRNAITTSAGMDLEASYEEMDLDLNPGKNQSWHNYVKTFINLDRKLAILDYAKLTGRTIPEFVAA